MSTLKVVNIQHPSAASATLTLDSSGNLALPAGSASTPALQGPSDTNTGLFFPAADTIAFAEGGTESLRIDSSGRLLMGASSARSWAGVTGQFQLEGTSFSTSSPFFINNQNSVHPAFMMLGKTRGTSVGSNTIVQNGDWLGSINFAGADGSALLTGANIDAFVDGTPGTNDMPCRLVFSTTADGASSPTERMRITQAGSVLFNTTSNPSSSGTGSGFVPEGDGRATLYMRTNTTGGRVLCNFGNPNGEVGSIQVSGTSTSYVTSSDYRLKENVAAISNGIARFQQLKPSRFNFIADPATPVDGFIAHEVQAVVPEAITGTKDEVDADGNPIYQGIDQSKLVPLLTAALQEAIGRIETLEAEVADLKAS